MTAEAERWKADFDRDGYLCIKGFCTDVECKGMMERMSGLIEKWDPAQDNAPVFSTQKDEQLNAQGKSDAFLDSADRISFFLEKGATDDKGALKPGLSKARSLNKVGHGLHVVDDVFKEYSHSDKVCSLVRALGWKNPVLPQSMYIFKQPEIGGEVTSHQDSTFLHTTPRVTCLGLWLALQDATLENGCLWARPGSHKEPVRRIFVRNPAFFKGTDSTAPKMIFEDIDRDRAAKPWQWEGEMPAGWEPPSKGLAEKGFIPVECKAGDLVVIHGSADHMSLPNMSVKERQTYQLHLIEGPSEGITWSPRNWLQYSDSKPFPALVPLKDEGKKRKADDAGITQ